MKTLLRSTIIVVPEDKPDQLLRNFLMLSSADLNFERDEEVVLWKFVKDFVRAHNHVPNVNSVRAHFDEIGEDRVVQHLEAHLVNIEARKGGDFENHLNARAEDRRKRRLGELLKEAGAILTSGLEFKDKKGKSETKFGAQEAIRHIFDHSHDIVAPTLGGRLSGEVTADTEDFLAEYDRAEADPMAGVGQWCGLEQVDAAINGAKRHELWIHAAFTGGLKSTWMLNWAYNQAVYGGHSTLLFSLEMPYPQVRRILMALHSMHHKFKDIRHKLGLQADPTVDIGLPYQNIRDGTLKVWKPNARAFLKIVADDLKDTTNEYGDIHIEVADPNKTDFTVEDLRNKAELIYSKTPFTLLFVDHIGLMAPRKWVSSTTDRLNEVVRDLKRLAMSFHGGQGIALVGLFQINREGFKRAMKAKDAGRKPLYNLTDLSYANECERSADIVTATWVDDDLRKENRVVYQNLKSRDQKPFEPFEARVEWPCRRIVACTDLAMGEQSREDIGDAIDKAATEAATQ